MGQPSFLDLSDRYEALSAAGDPLERLVAVVDLEVFPRALVLERFSTDLNRQWIPKAADL